MTDIPSTRSDANRPSIHDDDISLTPNIHKRAVMLYSRYERFWHWSQALLIFVLAFTGFNLHGSFAALPFPLAVKVHTYAAILLLVLWLFTTFWNFTTGQWKHYLPKNKGLLKVIQFYAYGILLGHPHPYSKGLHRKQNALQSLAYLTFMVIIGPALWASGIAYLLYGLWSHIEGGQTLYTAVVFVHTAAAFAMITFVVVHIYMTTTGKTVLHYIKTMITGYEKVELTDAEVAYLEEQEPELLLNPKGQPDGQA